MLKDFLKNQKIIYLGNVTVWWDNYQELLLFIRFSSWLWQIFPNKGSVLFLLQQVVQLYLRFFLIGILLISIALLNLLFIGNLRGSNYFEILRKLFNWQQLHMYKALDVSNKVSINT